MAIDFDPKTAYLEYLRQDRVEIEPFTLERLNSLLDNCQWEQPQTALDWNNLAVAALVSAESCYLYQPQLDGAVGDAFRVLHQPDQFGD